MGKQAPHFAALIRLAVGFAVLNWAGPARADELKMKVGESIVLSLKTNPSTGYRWVLDNGASKGVEIIRLIDLGPEPGATVKNDKPLVGAPTVQHWRITAEQEGRVVLVFGYGRTWERKPAIQSEVFTIDISRTR